MTPVPYITNIQRFCLDDGPGIRTTVFLKGCPLRCIWCHNPENQRRAPSLSFVSSLCTGCRACEAVCPAKVHHFDKDGRHHVDFARCMNCGRCAGVCPAGCLEILGTKLGVGEIVDTAERDKAYYREDGGLTISGGEPLAFPDFTEELVREARNRGIHTAVETSGCAPRRDVLRLAGQVDLWLFDFKAGTEEKHRLLCGCSNAGILGNLYALAEQGAQILLRYPVVPGFNDAEEDFRALAHLTESLCTHPPVELMPYHVLGISKAANIGAGYDPRLPRENLPEERLQEVKQRLEKLGVRVVNEI